MLFELSPSDKISIIGIFISTFLSVLFYKRLKKNKIIFFEKKRIQINSQKTTDFKDVKIIYENEEVHNYLNYLSGTIIIIGDKDITSDNIFTPMTFILNNESDRWQNFNILETTDLLQYEIIKNENHICIKTDLIKINDTISLEAYFTSEKNDYKISHRIAGLQKKVLILKESQYKNYIFNSILLTIAVIFSTFMLIKISYTDTLLDKGKDEEKEILSTDIYIEEKPIITILDSIKNDYYKYNSILYLHNKPLKNDSIFERNSKLNDFLYQKEKSLNTQIYEDQYSIMKKKKDLYIDLKLNNKYIENHKFAINDSISVSYNKRMYFNSSSNQEVDYELYIVKSLFYLMYFVLSMYLFHSCYKIYYYYKLKIIFKNTNI